MSEEMAIKYSPKRAMTWLRKRIIRYVKNFEEMKGKNDFDTEKLRAVFDECLMLIEVIIVGIVDVHNDLLDLGDEYVDWSKEFADHYNLDNNSIEHIIGVEEGLLETARCLELFLIDVSKSVKEDVGYYLE